MIIIIIVKIISLADEFDKKLLSKIPLDVTKCFIPTFSVFLLLYLKGKISGLE